MSKSKFSKRQIAGAILLSSMAIGATASGTASANLVGYIGKEASYGVGSYASDAWNWLKGSIGDYAVSTMDKGGEILKSGVNKIGDLASNGYNKVAGSKFGEFIGNVAGAIKNKTGDVYNWVKDSKGGQWVSDKAGDVYNWVKDSKVGNFVSEHAWGVAAIGLLGALTYGTYRAIKAGISYYSDKDFRNAKDNLLRSIDDFIRKIENDTNYGALISNLKALKESVSSSKKGDFNTDEARETINKVNEIKKTNEVKGNKNKVLEGLIELFDEIENNYKKYCAEYDKLNSNK